MLTHRLNKVLRPEAGYFRLTLGCTVVALAVSLGTVGAMSLLGFESNVALPAALAAAAAAAYATASIKK